MDLSHIFASFFEREASLEAGDVILVAFSGGPDSSALLAGLAEFAHDRGVVVRALHVDHGLDPGSSGRATAAAAFSEGLDIPCEVVTRDIAEERRRGESLEMSARRVRYRELDRQADRLGASYIATAHHRDDQAETVLLRLEAGHGLPAVAGMPSRRGRVVRPLLGCSRHELARWLEDRKFRACDDPTNYDCSVPRNRIRHRVLPALELESPRLADRLARLARLARRAHRRLDTALDHQLGAEITREQAQVSRARLATLPPALTSHALAHLLRRAGSTRRPSAVAISEFQAQIDSESDIGVDLGNGWRIQAAGSDALLLHQPPETQKQQPFAYTLPVPGEVHIGEISSSLRVTATGREEWMFRGSPSRAGLAISRPERLVVRNRRPGDRVRPLGSNHRRKLKDLLIDHRVPRAQRDRLPLLCDSERILWVPGITIDHGARIQDRSDIWLAEIIPND